MATAAELLAAEVCDDILTVDLDNRIIIIPKNVTNIGVESDDNVLYLHFRVPRYFCKTDLSEFKIRINYENAKGAGDLYDVKDVVITDDLITFDWLVGRYAVTYKGNVKFNVCMRDVAADGTVNREFNTTIATLPVLQGLETGETVVVEHADAFEQLKLDLFGTGDSVEQDIRSAGDEVLANISTAVDEYVAEHEEELTGATFTPNVSSAGVLSWTNDKNKSNPSSVNIKGPQGETGATFTPNVSSAGVLSWTNDKGLSNPTSVNIKGPQGEKGDKGDTGATGPQGEQGIQGEKGDKGDTGAQGETGESITSIVRTSGTGAAGTTDVYTITTNYGNNHNFQVYNGADGEGAGDMLKSIYDPQNKNTDIFAYVDGLFAEDTDVDAMLTETLGV